MTSALGTTPHRPMDKEIEAAVIAKARNIDCAIQTTVYGPQGAETPECAGAWETAVLIAQLQVRLDALEVVNDPPNSTSDSTHPVGYLRIRDRLAAAEQCISQLEALQQQRTPCPHIRSSDEGTSYCALAEATAAASPPDHFPDAANMVRPGSLVEAVGNVIPLLYDGRVNDAAARAAIHAVADWLQQGRGPHAAEMLREEANR